MGKGYFPEFGTFTTVRHKKKFFCQKLVLSMTIVGIRILAINNYYGLIRIINRYIDHFLIRTKDLIGLLICINP